MNRVVITGLGIYSTIGKNLNEVKDSLYNGKSGIVLNHERKEFRSFPIDKTGTQTRTGTFNLNRRDHIK